MHLLIVTTQDRFFLTHVVERALYFKQKGWNVSIAAEETQEKYKNSILALGFNFYDTEIKRKSLNPLGLVKAFFRLKQIYKDVKPDYCYNLGAKAIFLSTFLTYFQSKVIKIVNAPIGLGFVYASQSLKARVLRPLVDFLYKKFLNPKHSRVIIENQDDIDYFVGTGALRREEAYCILGAGVDTQKFKPAQNRPVELTVVMASRLIVEKGVRDFVRVAEILYNEELPVRCVLVGEPDYGNPSSISQKEFIDLKNNPAIECLGFCDHVDEVFSKAHICCFPSFYREGLPRVLIEAASSGLAIITTDTVGCRETVDGKNGRLLPVHDIEGMVQVIKNYLIHPEKLLEAQLQSRKIAIEKFDTSIICEKTYEVFKTLAR